MCDCLDLSVQTVLDMLPPDTRVTQIADIRLL